jgi:acyl-CoA synthetase (AMP-forming)/AMP-acid ligase II
MAAVGDAVVEQLLVGDVITTAAARAPQRVAATLDGRRLTFAEVADAAEHLAKVLLGRGVRRGDRVAWWAETSLDAVPLYFACAHIGAIFTPLNPKYTDGEAAPVLDRADPAVVITDDGRGGNVVIQDLMGERAPGAVEFPEVHEDDAHVIFFTSGTTGEPKGCVLSHRTQRLRAGNGSWPLGANICMFPQFHMAGWASTLNTWLSGDEMVYVTRPDADHLLDAVERHRAYMMYCIPAVWQRILDADRTGRDLSSLRRADTGTSATTPELLAGIADAFPDATTSIAYGSTEASLVCMLWPQDVLRKPGSVGPPGPGVHVRLDGDGELWARSSHLFSGYFRNPEATAAALVDGWYRTGELAACDDEGYYSIIGRDKDLIRTGGETVAPAEVDTVLQSHPALADAAVAGIPDDTWGEVITAFVVVRGGSSIELADLRRHCEGRLAPHKHPRRLMVVAAIPRTGPTGQVQRRRLVELAATAV